MSQNPFGVRAADFRLNIADWISVAPHDDNDLPNGDIGIALYCTGAGTIAFHNAWGETVETSLIANQIFPCSVRRILHTGTAASGIIVALTARRSSA